MPFEAFKSRVKIVRDEEVVKKWVEDQSWKTEYTCLNVPEPSRLTSRDEVEKHFRSVHKETIIKQVESHTLNGAAARTLRSPELARLVRQDMGSTAPVSAANRHRVEPAIRLARTPVLQGEQDRSPTFQWRGRISWTWKPRRFRKA